MKKLKVFESAVSDKWKISSGNQNSLGNYTFGFTENMRKENFPHINNTGTQNGIQALKEIIQGAEDNGEAIAKAINDSGIGFTDWKFLPNTSVEGQRIEIGTVDQLGNEKKIVLTKI